MLSQAAHVQQCCRMSMPLLSPAMSRLRLTVGPPAVCMPVQVQQSRQLLLKL